MDVSQYLEMFIEETKEHLQSLNNQILILEKESDNQETVTEIFRAAHSLKGMAGTMGFSKMQKVTHDLENVFSEIRSGNMEVSSKLVDVMFKGIDLLEALLDSIQNTSNEGDVDPTELIEELDVVLKEGLGIEAEEKTTEATKEEAEPNDKKEYVTSLIYEEHELNAIDEAHGRGLSVFGMTVYLSPDCILKSARAYLVLRNLDEVGDIIKASPSTEDLENERFDTYFTLVVVTKESEEKLKEVVSSVSEIDEVFIKQIEKTGVELKQQSIESKAIKNKEIKEQMKTEDEKSKVKNSKANISRTVRVDIEKLDNLMNLVSELIIAKNSLISIGNAIGKNGQKDGFNEQIEYLERITTNLHESVMKVRMVPIESVVNRFPRMIRDLSKKLNKSIELYMSGEDTELDRTVIDEIGDPLMHLLRNAVDHGIEDKASRIASGKQEEGTVILKAYQDGNNVVIEVKDDGKGINVDKIKQKVIERELATQDQLENLPDREIIDYIFRPGFSTAETVTDVSGRGVGLDVVKNKISNIGGNIEAKSEVGKGSTFIIRLPLTLAIIQALMVEVGTEKYAIPLGSIQTIEDVLVDDIKFVQGNRVITLRGNVIPIVMLEEVLDVKKDDNNVQSYTVVIVSKGDKTIGLVVDSLIGQQEIVIKSLGKLINVDNVISGATVLGDGEVALILDVNTLV
ncbi:MAG: chemotaxis protein CheA [Lachnospiraceae bacterium]|nr:chemotaxis protein CheA [Lachnospiraceae bacterium]